MVVYGRDNCPACKNVKTFLNALKVDYEYKDTQNTPGAREELHSFGFKSVPLIVEGNKMLVGFNPAELQELINH